MCSHCARVHWVSQFGYRVNANMRRDFELISPHHPVNCTLSISLYRKRRCFCRAIYEQLAIPGRYQGMLLWDGLSASTAARRVHLPVVWALSDIQTMIPSVLVRSGYTSVSYVWTSKPIFQSGPRGDILTPNSRRVLQLRCK